jgi:hypothetical protein
LDVARARGHLDGRPKGLNKSKRKHAVNLSTLQNNTVIQDDKKLSYQRILL